MSRQPLNNGNPRMPRIPSPVMETHPPLGERIAWIDENSASPIAMVLTSTISKSSASPCGRMVPAAGSISLFTSASSRTAGKSVPVSISSLNGPLPLIRASTTGRPPQLSIGTDTVVVWSVVRIGASARTGSVSARTAVFEIVRRGNASVSVLIGMVALLNVCFEHLSLHASAGRRRIR